MALGRVGFGLLAFGRVDLHQFSNLRVDRVMPSWLPAISCHFRPIRNPAEWGETNRMNSYAISQLIFIIPDHLYPFVKKMKEGIWGYHGISELIAEFIMRYYELLM